MIVAGLLLLRFGDTWLDSETRVDEGIYLLAFEAVTQGRSPFTVDGYLYPPAFAHLGSWSSRWLGMEGSRALLRLLSFCSLLVIAGWAVRWWRRFGGTGANSSRNDSLKVWFLVGGLLVVSTGVELGVAVANVSFMAIALLWTALEIMERRPVVAGCLLACSVLIKPFAVPAVAVLGVGGWVARHRPWLKTSISAGVASLVLNAPSPYLFEMPAARPSSLTDIRAVSIGRILQTLGVECSPLWILVLFTGAICSVAWWRLRRRQDRRLDLVLLCLLGMLGMPVIWSHSLIIFVPMLCGASALAWSRRSEDRGALPWVVLGAAAIIFSESGALDLLPALAQAVLLLPPLLAPIGLSMYLSRTAQNTALH